MRSAKLIVLDEVSMVDAELAADLLSFGKPVIVLGDHGQLPPVNGEAAFSSQDPDAVLSQIHRQAAEDPIIQMAHMARIGQVIRYGEYGSVLVVPQYKIETPQLLAADQVICGFNNTRFQLNNRMRRELGLEATLPEGPDEKIICLRHDHRCGLLNGMFLQLDEIEEPEGTGFKAVVFSDEGEAVAGYYRPYGNPDREQQPKKLRIYTGFFLDHQKFDPGREEKDWKQKRWMVEATFGYAITCHKSQGSQWDNVLVWDDGLGKTRRERSRWLYTAITRASERLVIAD
ncbi:MAG TPA: ATP-dependent RecD-like DNA helicase [Xanthobacteraceae bacterium]|nr:ATP-dependent RecD-like DNA helicase [Xanthobacteraceae bacterium]